jgi:hypothetical protein
MWLASPQPQDRLEQADGSLVPEAASVALPRFRERVAWVVYSRLLELGVWVERQAPVPEVSWMLLESALVVWVREQVVERSGPVGALVWARLARQVRKPAGQEASEALATQQVGLVPIHHSTQKGPKKAKGPAHSVVGECLESALNPLRYGRPA